MTILIITAILYLLFWVSLIAFAKPVMIQGNPNPTYSATWSLRNIGHKALYALAGIVELTAVAGVVYGIAYDAAWFVTQNKINLIWEILVVAAIGYLVYKFHTTIFSVIDKLFGA